MIGIEIPLWVVGAFFFGAILLVGIVAVAATRRKTCSHLQNKAKTPETDS